MMQPSAFGLQLSKALSLKADALTAEDYGG
jgi:hypothetical protein